MMPAENSTADRQINVDEVRAAVRVEKARAVSKARTQKAKSRKEKQREISQPDEHLIEQQEHVTRSRRKFTGGIRVEEGMGTADPTGGMLVESDSNVSWPCNVVRLSS